MKNKYNAVRSKSSDGRSFHSKGECNCYEFLRRLERTGEISDLKCQVSIRLGPNKRRWILDFKYFDNEIGKDVWADFKGFETDRWKHLLDLWVLEGPAPLRVYSGYGFKVRVTETITPMDPEDFIRWLKFSMYPGRHLIFGPDSIKRMTDFQNQTAVS